MSAHVSVIIPTYNGALYLESTLDSVLQQTYHDFEIILFDDESKDTTSNLIKKWSLHTKVRSFTQPNAGPGSARNLGIKKARGEIHKPHLKSPLNRKLSYYAFADGYDAMDQNNLHLARHYFKKAFKYQSRKPKLWLLYRHKFFTFTCI